MKKNIITFLSVLTFTTSAFQANSQANTTGSIIIDPYYGFPNFGKSFYKSIETSDKTSNFKASGIGPLGLRAEYLISDKIGIGFDFIYNSNRITYTSVDTTTTYDENFDPIYEVKTSEYERLMNRIRVHARINFHFDISNPNLDGYFGIGAGTNNRFRKFWIDGAVDTDESTTDISKITLMPVSMRICTGLRYYFTPNIGANMEIGLGGPLLSAGLSVKIK